MIPSAPVTRFAPSPTGELHLGNVRTALFNWLLARAGKGRFLLRIEDSDRERSEERFVGQLIEDLRWLGLDWDEGPGREGAAGPCRQSAREGLYRPLFERLEAADLAYPCFCTPEELARARTAQMAAGRPPRYPGTCARLSAEQRAERLAEGRRPTLRFRVPPGREIGFEDLVRGPQRFASDDIGDFVIRRADGTAAFFFGNAVDDALMGVTHVLRGEDHLANTPRQLLLLEALDLRAPAYGHLPLILGDDGAPLSKRNGSESIRALRETGFLPAAIVNHLARLGHALSDDPGHQSLEALAARFDLDRLGRSPARHDPQQLLHWQKAAIAAASDAELWDWLRGRCFADGRCIEDLVPPERALEFVHTVRDNIALPVDAHVWAGDLFAETGHHAPDARAEILGAGADFFEQALACLGAGGFRDFVRALAAATGRKGRALYLPLRAALTGELADPERGSLWREGPELGRLWALLGPDRIARRLRLARDLCVNERE